MDTSEISEIKNVLVGCLSSGEIERGIVFFNEKSNELPDLFRLECLGNISFYQRNIGDAIKFYEAATLLSPEYVIPRYLYLAGVKNEREKNFVDAFKYYQAAIGAEPSFVDAYVELGGLLVTVGDFEGALRCYEDAVRLDIQESSNHENLKMVLIELNKNQPGCYEEKLQAAKAAYEEIIKNGKSNPVPQEHHW
ncbi:tetratricopeptide (TPR) repeat protein [Oxalobacteraceae bacterium GrIS 1.11]